MRLRMESVMKCDLCKAVRPAKHSLLCVSCGELIKRLLTIEERLSQALVSSSSSATVKAEATA